MFLRTEGRDFDYPIVQFTFFLPIYFCAFLYTVCNSCDSIKMRREFPFSFFVLWLFKLDNFFRKQRFFLEVLSIKTY